MDEGIVKPATIVLRDFDPDQDAPCIYACWRNSANFSAKVPHRTPDQTARFFKEQTLKIRTILKNAKVRIACLGDDLNMIAGFSVTTGRHLNWIYVKVEYRGAGVGKMLMPKDVQTVTRSLTKIGAIIARKKSFVLADDL